MYRRCFWQMHHGLSELGRRWFVPVRNIKNFSNSNYYKKKIHVFSQFRIGTASTSAQTSWSCCVCSSRDWALVATSGRILSPSVLFKDPCTPLDMGNFHILSTIYENVIAKFCVLADNTALSRATTCEIAIGTTTGTTSIIWKRLVEHENFCDRFIGCSISYSMK